MSPEILYTDQPLVIRGHHLKIYKQLLTFYRSLGCIEKAVDLSVDFMRISLSQQKPEYRTDLLGTYKKDEVNYYNNYSILLKRFLELQDNHPVDILSNNKDDICNTCAIGKHCLMSDTTEVDISMAFNILGFPALISINSTGIFNTTLGEVKQKLLEK